MKGHGYVTLPSRQVGAVLGDSDVSTCAAWSTGHSAIHSLVTRRWIPPFYVGSFWDGQASWVNPECGLTEFGLRFVPLLFMQRGVRYTSLVGC